MISIFLIAGFALVPYAAQASTPSAGDLALVNSADLLTRAARLASGTASRQENPISSLRFLTAHLVKREKALVGDLAKELLNKCSFSDVSAEGVNSIDGEDCPIRFTRTFQSGADRCILATAPKAVEGSLYRKVCLDRNTVVSHSVEIESPALSRQLNLAGFSMESLEAVKSAKNASDESFRKNSDSFRINASDAKVVTGASTVETLITRQSCRVKNIKRTGHLNGENGENTYGATIQESSCEVGLRFEGSLNGAPATEDEFIASSQAITLQPIGSFKWDFIDAENRINTLLGLSKRHRLPLKYPDPS
ncbi:MAG: hypothetical protein EOP11_22140, partial [Proteobacteria bacterium]